MTLSTKSGTINALGIFGRLSKEQEKYFDGLEKRYGDKPDSGFGYDVFRHLTLTFIKNATIEDVCSEIDLLRDLKKFLPLRLKSVKPFVKDEVTMPGAEHIAIEFGLEQTKELVEYVKKRVGKENVVATPYTKVVWFVPKENQRAVIEELSDFQELEFVDFILIANKQDDEHTIYSSNMYKI